MEAGGSIVQDHLCLLSEFEANLGYMRPTPQNIRPTKTKPHQFELKAEYSGLGLQSEAGGWLGQGHSGLQNEVLFQKSKNV